MRYVSAPVYYYYYKFRMVFPGFILKNIMRLPILQKPAGHVRRLTVTLQTEGKLIRTEYTPASRSSRASQFQVLLTLTKSIGALRPCGTKFAPRFTNGAAIGNRSPIAH